MDYCLPVSLVIEVKTLFEKKLKLRHLVLYRRGSELSSAGNCVYGNAAKF